MPDALITSFLHNNLQAASRQCPNHFETESKQQDLLRRRRYNKRRSYSLQPTAYGTAMRREDVVCDRPCSSHVKWRKSACREGLWLNDVCCME